MLTAERPCNPSSSTAECGTDTDGVLHRAEQLHWELSLGLCFTLHRMHERHMGDMLNTSLADRASAHQARSSIRPWSAARSSSVSGMRRAPAAARPAPPAAGAPPEAQPSPHCFRRLSDARHISCRSGRRRAAPEAPPEAPGEALRAPERTCPLPSRARSPSAPSRPDPASAAWGWPEG